ncbi:MAG: hypothetical protein M5U12_17685 [Verrucomicrobia bacterium]|nr:hypothetical protein [Verrucomicrobiota bacterium]
MKATRFAPVMGYPISTNNEVALVSIGYIRVSRMRIQEADVRPPQALDRPDGRVGKPGL